MWPSRATLQYDVGLFLVHRLSRLFQLMSIDRHDGSSRTTRQRWPRCLVFCGLTLERSITYSRISLFPNPISVYARDHRNSPLDPLWGISKMQASNYVFVSNWISTNFLIYFWRRVSFTRMMKTSHLQSISRYSELSKPLRSPSMNRSSRLNRSIIAVWNSSTASLSLLTSEMHDISNHIDSSTSHLFLWIDSFSLLN